MSGRLIQLSGVIVDIIYWIDALPPPGGEARVRRSEITPGGGFNAMVSARRAGMTVAYGGTLGTGPMADRAAEGLAREGIACLKPRLPGQDQGHCAVLIDADGERTFAAASGADGIVTGADLAHLPRAPGDWQLLSGYALYYPTSGAALADWLAAGGPDVARLVFDPAPIIADIPDRYVRAALDAALWVTANRAEAEVLTGHADPAAAAVALAAGRPDAAGGALVRDGANGCHLALAGAATARHIPGVRVKAVDTNGAGDAHIGAFIAALARGEKPERAAAIANLAAALSTTREGPATAPTLAEIHEAEARATGG